MRIGIVNDMALAREALRRVIASAPGLTVAWAARDGAEAVSLTQGDPSDLILMDLFMPVMDGVEATRQIMTSCPTPILVVTATVSGHIGKVYEAMGHGALDAVDTPTLGIKGDLAGATTLLAKIETIRQLIAAPASILQASAPVKAECPLTGELLLMGASTGGPSALKDILRGLPRSFRTPIVIIQHIDSAFADGLASWLTEHTGFRVTLAKEGQNLDPGMICLAGTNDHLVFDGGNCLHYTPTPIEMAFRPSVDVFFDSVAKNSRSIGVAVLLTGMGRDGALGLLKLKQRGWHTIAQDEASSVVWGMPRAAVESGAAAEVLPLPRIASAIAAHLPRL
jgi:two-component system, chemotaxis family, response regulator WspF